MYLHLRMRNFKALNFKKFVFSLLGLLICLGSFHSVQAQIHLGARLGLNYSNVTGIHEKSIPRIGYEFGFVSFFRMMEDQAVYLQLELDYTAIGEANRMVPPYGKNLKQRIHLDYVQVPLLLKWYSNEAPVSLFVEAGPYIGFLVNKQIDLYTFPTLADNNEYSSYDVGAIVGIGVSFDKTWEVSSRFSLSAISQIKNPEVTGRTLNSVFTLGVSYSVDVRKQRLFRGRCRF